VPPPSNRAAGEIELKSYFLHSSPHPKPLGPKNARRRQKQTKGKNAAQHAELTAPKKQENKHYAWPGRIGAKKDLPGHYLARSPDRLNSTCSRPSTGQEFTSDLKVLP
jgi:hypothetical protein